MPSNNFQYSFHTYSMKTADFIRSPSLVNTEYVIFDNDLPARKKLRKDESFVIFHNRIVM